MPLSDFQHKIGETFVMGPGTIFTLSNVDGFGLGEKRERKYPIAGVDQTAWGREWRGGPVITFEGAIEAAGDPAAVTAGMALMLEAFDGLEAGNARTSPKKVMLWTYKLPGRPERAVFGRPNICRIATNQLVLGRAAFTATFDCRDKVLI